jgi:hypothetical protein
MANKKEKSRTDILLSVSQQIEWYNWKDETTGNHWEVSEVLYCRLGWILEQIKSGNLDKQEATDTLKMTQEFIETITDCQYEAIGAAVTSKRHNETLAAMAEEHRKAELDRHHEGYIAGLHGAADIVGEIGVFEYAGTHKAIENIKNEAAKLKKEGTNYGK